MAGSNNENGPEEIFSKALRAGRRTYFFDVRETRAGDYYLTITESKKSTNDDGSFFFKKHKIYLYKEDFKSFQTYLEDTTNFILNEKGEEVISEKHQSNFEETSQHNIQEKQNDQDDAVDKFTDISFDDI